MQPRAMLLRAHLCLCSALLTACAAPQHVPNREASLLAGQAAPAVVPAAAPWPEAAARFRAGGAWLGGDGAYSIDLGPQRVLWLFADTFIDPQADGSRENGPNMFIRNSVAIQSGPDQQTAHDLARASLAFSWGHNVSDGHNDARSFFADIDSPQRWIWPLHGARLPDGELLLFRMEVVTTTGGFGFAVDSWDAVAVDNADAQPEQWQPRAITNANKSFGKLIGSSVLLDHGYLYAYAVNNQGQDHAIALARWPVESLRGLPKGVLDDPEWFTANGFVHASALAKDATPATLFADGQVELSVHYEAQRDRFVEIQMQGLFVADANTQIGLRTAPHPEGPWSTLEPFYRPEESTLANAADLAAYAAKAHPEQIGPGLTVTYVVNDLKHATPPDTVYYPMPLHVTYQPAAISSSSGAGH